MNKIPLNNQELEALESMLDRWFNTHNIDAKNFCNRNRIGKLIKQRLKDLGHWRKLSSKKQKKLKIDKEVEDFSNAIFF